MGAPGFEIDPHLRAEFVDEALDGLRGMTEQVVRLEQQSQDVELMQAIFRVAHSIKGNAAFFGLHAIKSLAHTMEDVLDQLRQQHLSVDQDIVDLLLNAGDLMMHMFESVRDSGNEQSDEQALAACMEELQRTCRRAKDRDGALVELMRLLEQGVATSGRETQTARHTRTDVLQRALQLARNLVGQAAKPIPGAVAADASLQRIEALLGDDSDGALADADAQALDAELLVVAGRLDGEQALAIDTLRQDCQMLQTAVGLDKPLRQDFHKRLHRILAREPEASPPAEAATPPVPAQAESQAPARQADDAAGRTMRVSEASIDSFLAFVGELVVIGDQYDHLQAGASERAVPDRFADDLQAVNRAFHQLSDQLQESLMAVRRLPIQGLLQRAPRLIREVARETGKQITVQIDGGDLQVDKSHLDVLEAPLMHLLRNAADHGIETPAQRRQAGKAEQGRIVIRASGNDEELCLSISDDGAGIDRERVLSKAREQGLVAAGERPSDAEIDRLLFASGLSTAQAVTDISGRGVGMDAVRSAVESAGGSIAVSSQPGQGSRFEIRLPQQIATHITSGLIVRADGLPYVLPLDRLQGCYRPSREQVVPDLDGGVSVYDNDGRIMTLLPLAPVLGRDCSARDPSSHGCLAIVNAMTRRLAIQVDEVLGVRQVVLKTCPGLQGLRDLYRGAALLGDGEVAMVVDIDRLEGVA